MANFFGTDGIRGVFGQNLTPALAQTVGNALSQIVDRPKILIGSDTRLSSDILKSALASGVMLGGGDVVDVGIVPTACVAFLTKNNFDFGVMISASHNPPNYNGIKVFLKSGRKMNDEEEILLERYFSSTFDSGRYGTYKQKNLTKKYTDFLLSNAQHNLSGLTICLDASFGASFKIAPKIFRQLGAKVFTTACKNRGDKINENCGSLHIENLQNLIKKKNADFGFAFDGDADRVIAVSGDEVFDGDKILYILAKKLKNENKLFANTVVGTSHTNSGILSALNKHKINLIRTDIGDKYVIDAMEKMNLLLGGEQSGHIILRDKIGTGDGILTAIELSNAICQEGKTLGELFDAKLLPQENINIVVNDKIKVLNNEKLKEFVASKMQDISPAGRILVRASGTENKIRVMVEHSSLYKAKKLAREIKKMVEQV